MKKKLLSMILLTLALCILFVGCALGQKEITRIEIGDTLPRQFEYGSEPDFSNVSATIVYNDDTTKAVTSDELTFGEIDTAKPGKQTLTVTYEGFTQSFEVEVLKQNTDNTPARQLTSIEYVSGVPSAVFEGDIINYAGFILKAKFSDNNVETISVGSNANVKYNTIDVDTVGKHTITFTYMNKSCNVEIEVQAIKVVKIEVDYSSIAEGINKDTIKVSKIFNNGAFNFINGDDLTITQNGDVYTITYVDAKDGTFTANIESSKTPILESIEIVSHGYENTVLLVGDSFGTAGIFCKAHYSNGASANLAHTEFTVSFSTLTAGENDLTVTYIENDNITATVKIKVRAIQTINIDTSTVKTKMAVGSTLDTAAIKLSITCDDGTTVIRSANSVDLTNLDLETPNDTSYVTATYNGVVSEKLYIRVIGSASEYFILGAELPENLSSFENKKKLFKNKNNGYSVGDDNAFILKLIVSALDENDEEISGDDIVFRSYYELYLDGVQLTDNLATYVTIDAAKHTLDFTEAAIGKTFKIVVCPEGYESLASNITVTVVNGFNIYEAWELNYLTNINDFDYTATSSATSPNQLVFVDAFLNGKGITADKRPTNLAGIVLHGDLILKPEDLPRQYFLGDDYTQEFWDRITLFPHATDSADNTFTFYGNYNTIHTYMLPAVCELGTGNQNGAEMPTGVAVSNAQLFRFTSMAGWNEYYEINNSAEEIGFDFNAYSTTIRDLYLRDDNPSSNDEWKAERALRGLIGMKLCYQTVNLDNVRIEAFYISTFLDYDYVTLNVNESVMYNSYQNHVYIWCENHLLDNNDALPGDNHHGSVVNVTASTLTKCGGPIFLAQTSGSAYNKNSKSSAEVNVSSDSEIWSFVTGEEVWFTIIGQTAAVKSIIGLGQYYGSPYGTNGTTYITEVGEVENLQGQFINIIMINLDSSFGGSDVDGSFSIVDGENKTTYLDMNDTNGNYGNADVSGCVAMTGGQAPVIETATGGVLMYTGDDANPYIVNRDKLTDGDYITFHNIGMGIVLGFNVNDTIERLPATN